VSLVQKIQNFLCEIKSDLLLFLSLFRNVIMDKLSFRKWHWKVAETVCMGSIPSHISHFVLILLNSCTSLLARSYVTLKILEFLWIKSLNMSHMHTCISVGKIYRSKLSVQIILRQQTAVRISTALLNVSKSNRSHFYEFYASFSSSSCFLFVFHLTTPSVTEFM